MKDEFRLRQNINLNSPEAVDLMVNKAKLLVNQLVSKRGNDRPPFLPKEYSHLVNIKEILQTELGETSGLLLKFHDGYVVKVNRSHYLVRQRFSCAHEIGHILFDELQLDNYVRKIEYRTYNPSKTNELRSKARENLCDIAAAELLMPETIFRKYIDTFGLSITSIEHLAKVFMVSSQATARRIAEVSNEPCIMILWQPWPKNNPTMLIPSSGNRASNNSKILALFRTVKATSAMFNAYRNDAPVKTWKLFKDGMLQRRLPIEAKGFGSGNYRFVISFVYPDRGTQVTFGPLGGSRG